MCARFKSPIVIKTRKALEKEKAKAVKKYQKRKNEIQESQRYMSKKENKEILLNDPAYKTLFVDKLKKTNYILRNKKLSTLDKAKLLKEKNVIETSINIFILNRSITDYLNDLNSFDRSGIKNKLDIFNKKFESFDKIDYFKGNEFMKKTIQEFNKLTKDIRYKASDAAWSSKLSNFISGEIKKLDRPDKIIKH